MRDRDVFQLGYLPHLIGAHFEALAIYLEAREGATGELATRAEAMPAALQQRGPEVVSAVWQVARVLAANGITPPPEPRTGEDAASLFQATTAAVPAGTPVFVHARRCGLAERAIDLAWRTSLLWSIAPEHPQLAARAAASRAALEKLAAEEPASDCPTTQMEAATVTVVAQAVAKALADPQHDQLAGVLATAKQRIAGVARSLEAVAWGTPRVALRAWFDKQITGGELLRRIAEHHRWNIPVRVMPGGGAAPRTISQGDTTAMFAFSDRPALDARPPMLARGDDRSAPGARGEPHPDEQQVLTVPGAWILGSLPEDIDVLVLDASADPASGINYRRAEQAQRLKQTSSEVAFELGACDWSRLDLDILRRMQFWVLINEGKLSTPVADDGYGRVLPAVYATPAALDAHLADATPEQREKLTRAQRYLLPGHALFSTLVQGAGGFVLNPRGPGRSRAFNRRTLEALAAKAQVGPSSAISET